MAVTPQVFKLQVVLQEDVQAATDFWALRKIDSQI
jgi:hypothetical protein